MNSKETFLLYWWHIQVSSCSVVLAGEKLNNEMKQNILYMIWKNYNRGDPCNAFMYCSISSTFN